MAEYHPHAESFLELIRTAQQAYTERRVEDYLGYYLPEYTGAALGSDYHEDFEMLAARMRRDAERYELVKMDFTIERYWFQEDTGYAHLEYDLELRHREKGHRVLDKRTNLVAARHLGDGVWRLSLKVKIEADTQVLD